jgi:hypothetical protein
LIRERYEELLWWLLMPSLIRLAGQSAPSRAEAAELSSAVATALDAAKAAGYRVEVLTGKAPNIDQPDGSASAADDSADAEETDEADVEVRGASPKRV